MKLKRKKRIKVESINTLSQHIDNLFAVRQILIKDQTLSGMKRYSANQNQKLEQHIRSLEAAIGAFVKQRGAKIRQLLLVLPVNKVRDELDREEILHALAAESLPELELQRLSLMRLEDTHQKLFKNEQVQLLGHNELSNKLNELGKELLESEKKRVLQDREILFYKEVLKDKQLSRDIEALVTVRVATVIRKQMFLKFKAVDAKDTQSTSTYSLIAEYLKTGRKTIEERIHRAKTFLKEKRLTTDKDMDYVVRLFFSDFDRLANFLMLKVKP